MVRDLTSAALHLHAQVSEKVQQFQVLLSLGLCESIELIFQRMLELILIVKRVVGFLKHLSEEQLGRLRKLFDPLGQFLIKG